MRHLDESHAIECQRSYLSVKLFTKWHPDYAHRYERA
jgi:hypothetical protein